MQLYFADYQFISLLIEHTGLLTGNITTVSLIKRRTVGNKISKSIF